MATPVVYEIEDPTTRKVYRIETDEGVSQEDALSQFQSLSPDEWSAYEYQSPAEVQVPTQSAPQVPAQPRTAPVEERQANAMLMPAPDATEATTERVLRPDSGAIQSLLDPMVRGGVPYSVAAQALERDFPGTQMQSPGEWAALQEFYRSPEGQVYYANRSTIGPAMQETGLVDPEAPTTMGEEFVTSAQRGLGNMANSATGLAALGADIVGADETSVTLLDKYIQTQANLKGNLPTEVGDAVDISSFGEAGMWAANVLGGLTPQIAESLATGGVGSLAFRSIAQRSVANFVEDQIKNGLTREAAEQAAARMVSRMAQRAGVAATAGSSVGQSSGMIFGDTYAETGERAPWTSLLAGTASGALDSILPARLLAKIGGDRVANEVVGGLVERYGRAAVGDFLVEGGTEALQEVIEGLPASAITGDWSIDGGNILEAFLRGGFGGATASTTVEAILTGRAEAQGWQGFGLEQTIQPPTSAPRTAGYRAEIAAATTEAQTVVNELTTNWENAPNVVVRPNFNRLKGVDNDALGVFRSDGSVSINLEAVMAEAETLGVTTNDMISAITFHEVLGHSALTQKYQADLDDVLGTFYDSGNSKFRELVDTWMEQNPDAYTNEAPEVRVIRATEEVMAEFAQDRGIIDRSMLDRVLDVVRKYARQMGADWKYSEREVKSILSVAQRELMDGSSTAIVPKGLTSRYERRSPTSAGFNRPKQDDRFTTEDRRARRRTGADNTRNEIEAARRAGIDPADVGLPDKYAKRRAAPQTQEFREWFSDSSVVDSTGEPLIVYHGTSKDTNFTSFKMKDRGVWFTEDTESASSYAVDNDSRGFVRDPNGPTPWSMKETNTASRVFPAYLKIENPKVYSGNELRDATYAKGGENYARGEAALFRELRSQGYDGVKLEGEEGKNLWVVLNKPSQIKSATGNRGTFDESKSDVRYARSRKKDVKIAPRDLSPEELFESLNAYDLLKSVTTGHESEVMSLEAIQDAAIARGVAPSDLLRLVKKSPGELTQKLYMYDIAADKLNTRVTTLNSRIMSGNYTVADKQNFLKAIASFEELTSRIFETQSELGRALRAIQEMSFTKNKLTTIRDALEGINGTGLETMDDPATFQRFAASIQQALKDNKKTTSTGDRVISILNIPRAVMSSVDLSAPLRQGLFFISRPEYWKSFGFMLQTLPKGGSKRYADMMKDIKNRPTYVSMVEAGLGFTEVDGELALREESFQTDLAQKIPVLGRAVRITERAYAGFLNKLRADVFDAYYANYEALGVDVAKDAKLLRGMGSFINSATGRANLPTKTLRSSSLLLNAVLFSPRLIMSRINLTNPAYYATLPPHIRKTAIIQAGASYTIVATSVALIATMFPDEVEVELDPRSTDFGKIKVFDTRYDVSGGVAQYITLYSRFLTGAEKNSSGDIKPYGSGPFDKNRSELLLRFARNKLSPNASFVADAIAGEDAVGEPFEPVSAVVSRTVPLFLQDYAELVDHYGAVQGSAMAVPVLFGVGANTYVPFPFDPTVQIEPPESFEMKDIPDGENYLISSQDGVVTLTPEARQMWGSVVNVYFQTLIQERMIDESWDTMTEAEKADVIAEVRAEARSEGKKYVLPLLGIEE